jgi:hypothetical protein
VSWSCIVVACGAYQATGAPQTFSYDNSLQFDEQTTKPVLLETISTAGDYSSIEMVGRLANGAGVLDTEGAG